MNLLDMKTVIVSYMITNVICALVMTMLWRLHRGRFDGTGFWLADFALQFIALILVVLRGIVPDFISMTVSNALGVGGAMLLLAGLERFWVKRRSQFHNAVLLIIFIATHAYFVFIYPSLKARNIIFSLGLLVICSQCAWLMLRGVDIEVRHHTRNAGILFVAYCLVSIVRILVDVFVPAGNDFFHSNVYDTSALILYQMLSIMLVFSLFMMVNRRLVMDLEVDITAREQTENALRLSDEKFQKAFHSSPDAVLITRVNDGQIVEVNDSFCLTTGYSREEALGHSTLTLGLWAIPKERESFVSTLCEHSRIRGVEYDFRSKSGSILNGLVSAEIILLGGVSHILAAIHDITERKRTDEKLQQLSRAVEQSPASIVITDTKGKIEYINPRFTRVTGYSVEEAIGQNPRILKTDLTPKETYRELWETVTAGRDWQGEFVNRKKSGEIYYELASISPILNAHGVITHYVAVKENITDRKESQIQLRSMNEQLAEQIKENLKLQEILREQAIRDPLTSLYNRRYLYETMGRELARARREKYPVSFMMMDIDYFKQFNDTYGHDVGDMILVALAELLRTHTRQGDIACRYGGEEFLVIMPQVGEADARRRAEEIRHSFHKTEVDYGGIRLSTAISIGVAFYPKDGGDSDAVIKAADAAMYMAKQAGRNCMRVWEAKPQS
ncbi:Response regulator PleD [Anaerolineales bacterium]|nr:Response regulator PleD [Anaerolineales bacterium]